MARYKIDPKKKRVPVPVSTPKEVIDKLGKLRCKDIAEIAILKEYEKMKTNF